MAALDAPHLGGGQWGGCTGLVTLAQGTCTTSGTRMGLADWAPQTKGELWGRGSGHREAKGHLSSPCHVSDTLPSTFRTVSTDRL